MTERTGDGTAFQTRGPADAPVVSLIHGLGLSRALWRDITPVLATRFRVLTYDLFGHGDSGPTPEPASLTLFSEQLARLLDSVNVDRAAVVGFSIGGMINRRFALDHGERVTALAILNSPHDRGEEAQELVEGRAAQVRDAGAMATLDAALERWFTPGFRASRPEEIGRVRAWRAGVDAESYAQAAWVLANGVRELIGPSPPIRIPSLVMTSENDSGSTPAMSHAIAAEIAGSETLIVPGLKHLGLMEKPDVFSRPVLDFLERTL
ncbi:MAG: alpha/beta fold hydrolase [Pseudomonadota bacterium]